MAVTNIPVGNVYLHPLFPVWYVVLPDAHCTRSDIVKVGRFDKQLDGTLLRRRADYVRLTVIHDGTLVGTNFRITKKWAGNRYE